MTPPPGEGTATVPGQTSAPSTGRTAAAGRAPTQSAGEDRHRRVVELSPVALVEVDTQVHVQLWNQAAEALFGWSAGEALGHWPPTVPPEEREVILNRAAAMIAGASGSRETVDRPRRDGTWITVDKHVTPLRDADGRVTGFLVAYTDSSRQRRLELDLRERLRQQDALATLGQVALDSPDLQTVLDKAVSTVAETLDLPSAVLIELEPDGQLRYAACHGWRPPAGTRPFNGEGSPGMSILHGHGHNVVSDTHEFPPQLQGLMRGLGLRSAANVTVMTARGPWGVLIAHSTQAGRFDEDDLHFLRGVGSVIAAAEARCRAEQETRHRASHDALTGLPNRELFREQLADALHQARRAGRRLVLLLLDLDNFRDVNDSQGHATGDAVLRQVARRLRQRVGDLAGLARMGGDEFAVVLQDTGEAADAVAFARDISLLLREPFESPAGPVSLGVSIGVAVHDPRTDRTPAEDLAAALGIAVPTAARRPADPQDPELEGDPVVHRLLMQVDVAMHRAKSDRCLIALYDRDLDIDPGMRLNRVADLREAIDRGQITVAYQPIVHLATHRVRSFEALARWTHAERGPQSPIEFVTLAEQSGLIGDLTDAVLTASLRQSAIWHRQGRDLAVGVNLSPSLLISPDYVDHLRHLVEASGLPADRLRIEVTESTLVGSASVAALRRIQAWGPRIAVDDFGTGYSSLGRLKELPVQTLKIDRTFVRSVCEDPRDAAIIRSVITLARELELRVIAEGIETVEVARLLTQLGVERAQGYLFSRPLPGDQFERWHDDWLIGRRPCCSDPDRFCTAPL